jgi:hypothetical protein
MSSPQITRMLGFFAAALAAAWARAGAAAIARAIEAVAGTRNLRRNRVVICSFSFYLMG